MDGTTAEGASSGVVGGDNEMTCTGVCFCPTRPVNRHHEY